MHAAFHFISRLAACKRNMRLRKAQAPAYNTREQTDAICFNNNTLV